MNTGIGEKIVAYREQYDVEVELANTIMKTIFIKMQALHSLQLELDGELTKLRKDAELEELERGFDKLEKLNVFDLNKHLRYRSSRLGDLSKRWSIAQARYAEFDAEIKKIRELQQEAREALARAEASMPNYTKFVSDGRHDVPPGTLLPMSFGKIFLTEKGGEASELTPLPMPASAQPPVDINKALFDAQLARRFQNP
jgi:hypothetical protein